MGLKLELHSIVKEAQEKHIQYRHEWIRAIKQSYAYEELLGLSIREHLSVLKKVKYPYVQDPIIFSVYLEKYRFDFYIASFLNQWTIATQERRCILGVKCDYINAAELKKYGVCPPSGLTTNLYDGYDGHITFLTPEWHQKLMAALPEIL